MNEQSHAPTYAHDEQNWQKVDDIGCIVPSSRNTMVVRKVLCASIACLLGVYCMISMDSDISVLCLGIHDTCGGVFTS